MSYAPGENHLNQEIEPYRIKFLARLIYSTGFEVFISFVIIVNAICLAILTMPGISPELRENCRELDATAFTIYVIELGLRMVSYGKKPWKFFGRGWNIFDFLVIASTPLLQGQTAVLRLLRLLRLVRIFRFLPEVRVLTQSIIRSIPPLLSLSALIGIMLFLYGMGGFYLFSDELPNDWGSITTAMTTLLILLTLENFPSYFVPALEVEVLALPYFLSFVFFIVFTVLNVLIGIVLNAMDEARVENAKREREKGLMEDMTNNLQDILADDKITDEELRTLKNELLRLRGEANK
ncbi:MAG: ion transporter [Candidatus Nanopelagicales bacterium]